MRRAASTPVMPGILMSIRTRSGASSATRSSASSPVSASPTIAKPATRRSTCRAAIRKGRESSTTSTRTFACSVMPTVCRSGASAGRVLTRPPGGVLATLACSEVDEHRCHPAVEVLLLREAELGEDRIGVLLHGALGQHQRGGDGGVALALRHLAEHLELAWGERVH